MECGVLGSDLYLRGEGEKEICTGRLGKMLSSLIVKKKKICKRVSLNRRRDPGRAAAIERLT